MLKHAVTAGAKYALRLEAYLKAIGTPASGVLNPDRKDILGSVLGHLFTWQFVSKYAEAKLKELWPSAQADEGGILPSDDVLRTFERGQGGAIYCESRSFALLFEVTHPRRVFDKETFLLEVSKKYGIPLGDLNDLADKCKIKQAPALTKRVLPT